MTGVGVVHGREVMVVANDATVKGGTYFPMTVKKHLRAQEIARENRLPCIYLVDSGGAFLPMQSEVFQTASTSGGFFIIRPISSAAGIPQIAAVFFSDARPAALTSRRCPMKRSSSKKPGYDFSRRVPPLVKAATGEIVTAEELGGGDVHSSHQSGVTDHLADNDEAYTSDRLRDPS